MKPDLSDLLPQFAAAFETEDTNKQMALYVEATRRYRQHCPKRLSGQRLKNKSFIAGPASTHNALIDLLDEDYPMWRGYVPGQRNKTAKAA